MSGNIAGQIIPLLFIPLITRLYSPEQFGILAFYLSIVTIVGGVASGKYELRAVVVSDSNDSHDLFMCAILSAICVAFIFHLLVMVVKHLEPEWLSGLADYYYLIAIGAFAIALLQIMNYWAIKKEYFLKLSYIKAIQAACLVAVSISLYYTPFQGEGLLAAEVVSRLLAGGVIFFFVSKIDFSKFNLKSAIKLGIGNIGTPLRLVPASLMNLGAKQLPIYFFTIFFNPTFTGFLMISQRLIMTPLSVFSNSIAQVFLQKTAVEFQEKGECKKTYLIGLLVLSLIPLIPFVIIYLYIEPLVELFLGKQWVGVGEFIRVLMPFYYIYFVSGTLNILIISSGRELLNLFMQFIHALITLIMVLIVYFFNLSENSALILYSVLMSLYFIIALMVTYDISKGNKNVVR